MNDYKFKNQAMNQCLDQIADAFRPERKEKSELILQGHRVKQMVQGGRYSFPEAIRLMNINEKQIRSAYHWLAEDNGRLNHKYDSKAHGTTPEDLFMLAWFSDETANMTDAEVVQLGAP